MNSSIFIPQKIKVGFVKRTDTYTGKLAYVIYYDQKGILRKEKSFNGWRDKSIECEDFVNEPLSGFVLNKKAGDYSSNWNHRQAYVRVYDPRGFEFEITIENLLYILENTNSIKGKGLDGEFVYGWDGANHILIPTDSPDYIRLVEYNQSLLNRDNINKNTIIHGATYLTKNCDELIYLGRYKCYSCQMHPLMYFFAHPESGRHIIKKSLSKFIIKCVSPDIVSNYFDLLDELEHRDYYSPINRRLDEYIVCSVDEVREMATHYYWTSLYIRVDGHDIWMPVDVGYNRMCVSHYDYDNFVAVDKIRSDSYQLSLDEFITKFTMYKRLQYLENGKLRHIGRAY